MIQGEDGRYRILSVTILAICHLHVSSHQKNICWSYCNYTAIYASKRDKNDAAHHTGCTRTHDKHEPKQIKHETKTMMKMTGVLVLAALVQISEFGGLKRIFRSSCFFIGPVVYRLSWLTKKRLKSTEKWFKIIHFDFRAFSHISHNVIRREK